MTRDNPSLKILHILDHGLPLHSGYAFRSQNILRAQLKRGWQPVVLTSPKHEQYWKGHWRAIEEIDGCRYYRTGGLFRGVFLLGAEPRLMVALARRIREIVKIEKPDLLHAHSPILNVLPALWVGRKLGLPVVYEIRAFWEDAAVDHGTYRQNSWKYKLVRSIEIWVCRKSDQVAVICHGLKGDLIKRGIPPEKLTVVLNGINTDNFENCKPDAEYLKTWRLTGKKIIGFVGSFYRYEGLDLLLDAVAHLARTRSDIILLLVGGGQMEAELKAQIERLHLNDKVIMPGRIPHDRIPGIYALMDVLAYPRYSMRLTELVTPLKPLEAMGMGKALVASDIGGHRELIRHGHTGLLFPAGNALALAEALERVLNEPGFREDLTRQATLWVHREHPWEKTTTVYSDIYSKAMAKSHKAFKAN